jgi:hypothetical protein
MSGSFTATVVGDTQVAGAEHNTAANAKVLIPVCYVNWARLVPSVVSAPLLHVGEVSPRLAPLGMT